MFIRVTICVHIMTASSIFSKTSVQQHTERSYPVKLCFMSQDADVDTPTEGKKSSTGILVTT